MARKYVKIFFDWLEKTSVLTFEEKGRLIDAIVTYARDESIDVTSTLTGAERVLFPVFQAPIDGAIAAYNAITLKNKSKTEDNKKEDKEDKKDDKKEDKEKDNADNAESGGVRASPSSSSAPEAKKKAAKAYPTGFEEFWSAYPRKTDKGAAYKYYNARLKDGWSPEELLESARNYASEVARRHTEERYIKHAKTFLSADTPFTDFLPKRAAQEPNVDDEFPFAEWGL